MCIRDSPGSRQPFCFDRHVGINTSDHHNGFRSVFHIIVTRRNTFCRPEFRHTNHSTTFREQGSNNIIQPYFGCSSCSLPLTKVTDLVTLPFRSCRLRKKLSKFRHSIMLNRLRNYTRIKKMIENSKFSTTFEQNNSAHELRK